MAKTHGMNTADIRSVATLFSPFDAAIPMPGSKSVANRSIIAACLAKGVTTMNNATPCDDVARMVKNLQRMGYNVSWTDRKTGSLTIVGGIPKMKSEKPVRLNCGNAGTTLRFLTSLACITPGHWIVTGNDRMRSRPIGDLARALRELGADIADTNGMPPLRVRGGSLVGNSITLDANKSSQFLSSLLLIGSTMEKGLRVTVASTLASPTYVDITRNVLSDFGVKVTRQRKSFTVPKSASASPGQYAIEGDWSAAGAFLVLAELSGSAFSATNLPSGSRQGDRMLPACIAKLRGKGNRTIDCRDIPDQVMNLSILAAHRSGNTVIKGIKNLRIKETDRIHILAQELKKAGVRIAEVGDELHIQGGFVPKRATLHAHDDHRMAMCFAVLGALHDGIRIKDPMCVTKSYPHFYRDFEVVTRSSRCIVFVGMRGVGKTTIGSLLAKAMKLHHIDIDVEFVRTHGDIRKFVEMNGWASFRNVEEQLALTHLAPGSVLSLGGGAIESAAVRNAIAEHAVVVFLEAPQTVIIQRLHKESRPPLSSLSLEEEVRTVMKKRVPLYRSVADITVRETKHPSLIVKQLLASLHTRCTS